MSKLLQRSDVSSTSEVKPVKPKTSENLGLVAVGGVVFVDGIRLCLESMCLYVHEQVQGSR